MSDRASIFHGERDAGGDFDRQPDTFRSWITTDGFSPHPAPPGCHRTPGAEETVNLDHIERRYDISRPDIVSAGSVQDLTRRPGGNALDRRLTILAALLILSWVGHASAEMQPDAVGILKRMFQTYASAPAFACEGSCDDHEEGSALPPDHRTMTVRFARPDRFRLAWTQKDFHGKSGTSVIFARHGQTFFREQGNTGEAEGEPSLARAISSCAGISLGLSYLVPALLLDDPGYLNFVSLRQETDANSGDGRPCWKLSGKTGEGAQWELLIDRETCALREAAETNVLAPATAQQARDDTATDHPVRDGAPLPPPHAIRTLYRFTNIQFTGSWPENIFAETTPAEKKKR